MELKLNIQTGVFHYSEGFYSVLISSFFRSAIFSFCFLLFMFCSQNIFAQTPGPWNTSSGVAQTTTSSAVGLSTTTPNARLNLVNPSFYDGESGSYYSHDPFHIQFPDLTTMLILNKSGMFGLRKSVPNSYFHLHVTATNHNMFEITKLYSGNTSRIYMDARMTSSSHLALNPIIQSSDGGIIFSDNNLASNSSSGFVIAPNSITKSGIRISSNGDLEISNGNLVMNDGSNNQFKVTIMV